MGASSSMELRKLASWYRQFAERTGNPTVWEARLRTAEDLDAEADRIERLARLGPETTVTRGKQSI